MTRKTGRTFAQRLWRAGVALAAVVFCVVYYQIIVANLLPAPRILSLADFMPEKDENARDFYIKAVDALPPAEQARIQAACPQQESGLAPSDNKELPLAEKLALVRAHADTLATIRQGLRLIYIEPLFEPFDSSFPYLPRFRTLACLLALEAQTRAAQGDWAGAANADMDAIQFGEDIINGLNLKGVAPSVEIQAMGQEGLAETIPHLNAAQAKAAARRMETLIDHRVPFDMVMRFEKWYGETDIYFLFRHDRWRGEPRDALRYDPGDPRSRAEQFKAHIALYFLNKRHILNNYTRYIDRCIVNADQGYPNNLPLPPKTDDFLTPRLLVDFRPMQALDIHSQLQNDRLELALALRAYRLDHGAFPATLNQLAPDYLLRLPTSSQTARRQPRYKADGDRYTLDFPDDPGENPANPPRPVTPWNIDAPIPFRITAGR